jgi:PAS domain S-box-containing protein
VAILEHLSAQFAIAVENALLYDSLNRKIRELQESDERYELAVAGSEAGLWDWDIVSNELYSSDRFKELLGFAPDEFVLTIDEFWNRLHPEDHPAVRLALDKHLAERIPYDMDYRLQTKSGEFRWFHARGQALWDDVGTAIRMSGSVTDIHEREQAEEALRESRNKLVKAGQVARMGFLDWNLKTNDMLWSRGVYDLYGIAPDTPVTLEQTVDLIHPDDLEFVNEHLDMAVQGIRDYHIDHRIVRPDGEVIWVHARADLQRDEEGIPASLLGTVVDITDRKSAEEGLLESEERFRKLMEQSPQAIVIMSPEGQITQVNAAWMRLWGINEEETSQVLASYNMRTDPQIRDLGFASLVEEAFAGESVVLPPMEYSGSRAVEDMRVEGVEATPQTWISRTSSGPSRRHESKGMSWLGQTAPRAWGSWLDRSRTNSTSRSPGFSVRPRPVQ